MLRDQISWQKGLYNIIWYSIIELFKTLSVDATYTSVIASVKIFLTKWHNLLWYRKIYMFGKFLKVFSGHKEMLDSGLCDVLVVSSPNMTHCEILMDIISHPNSHHVLVEKPLCTTVADCRKVCSKYRIFWVFLPDYKNPRVRLL